MNVKMLVLGIVVVLVVISMGASLYKKNVQESQSASAVDTKVVTKLCMDKGAHMYGIWRDMNAKPIFVQVPAEPAPGQVWYMFDVLGNQKGDSRGFSSVAQNVAEFSNMVQGLTATVTNCPK